MKRSPAISYKDAMEILQQMFTGLDEETIKSVLYMNSQPKLSIYDFCEKEGNQSKLQSRCLLYVMTIQMPRDNIFSGGQQQQQQLDGFIDPQVVQEREDLRLAQQLQNQFDREANNQQRHPQYQMQSQYQYQQPSRPSQSKNDKKQKEKEKKEREKREKERKEKEKKNKQNPAAQSVINYESNEFAGDDNDFKINKNQSQMKPKKTFSQKVKGLKQNFMSLFKKKKKQNQQQQSNAFHQNEQLAIDDDAGIELLDLNEQQLNFSDEEPPQEKQQQQQYQSYGNEERKWQEPIKQKEEESNADLEKFDVDEEEEQGALKHQIYSTNYKQSNKQQTLLDKQDNSDDDMNLQL